MVCFCSGPHSNVVSFLVVLEMRASRIPRCGIFILQNPNQPTKYCSCLVLGVGSDSSLFLVDCGVSRVAPAQVIPKNFTAWLFAGFISQPCFVMCVTIAFRSVLACTLVSSIIMSSISCIITLEMCIKFKSLLTKL